MRTYIYIIVQYDYAHHEDEATGRADHMVIVSCHTTLGAANAAAETWAIEACGGDEDHTGYDDRVDFADDLTRECFDTTFYLSDGDPDSIRIKVVKKKLRGQMPPASASLGNKTTPRSRPEESISKLRGPIWRELEAEDGGKEEPVVAEPATKRQKM